jgi:hypothetical protein
MLDQVIAWGEALRTVRNGRVNDRAAPVSPDVATDRRRDRSRSAETALFAHTG